MAVRATRLRGEGKASSEGRGPPRGFGSESGLECWLCSLQGLGLDDSASERAARPQCCQSPVSTHCAQQCLLIV